MILQYIIFVESIIHFLGFFDHYTAFIWNRNLCNIINVFTVTFDQLNVSLLNKSINSFQKKSHQLKLLLWALLTQNFWTVVYMCWASWQRQSGCDAFSFMQNHKTKSYIYVKHFDALQGLEFPSGHASLVNVSNLLLWSLFCIQAGSPTSVNAPYSFHRTSVTPSNQDICR